MQIPLTSAVEFSIFTISNNQIKETVMKRIILLSIVLISLCSANPQKTELHILPSLIDGSSYIVHKIKGTELRDGVEVDFYTDGKVKSIVNYENGKVNGVWLRLNQDG